MGFWGTYVVGCSDRPLMELEALTPSADRVRWQRRGGEGWQVVQIHRGPDGWDSASLPAAWERVLISIVEQTGRPVLAAVVLDSDGAQLVDHSPKAGRWGGWLGLDRIIMHLDSDAAPYAHEDENCEWQVDEGEEYQHRIGEAKQRLYEVGPPAHLAAPLAVRWANEAGYTPTCSAVESAMDNDDVFVEDQFFRFLGAMGLPELVDTKP